MKEWEKEKTNKGIKLKKQEKEKTVIIDTIGLKESIHVIIAYEKNVIEYYKEVFSRNTSEIAKEIAEREENSEDIKKLLNSYNFNRIS